MELLRYTRSNSIGEIDASRWDAVAHRLLVMKHSYCRLMEAGWRTYEPRYLLLEDGQGPCALAVANKGETFGNQGLMKWLYRRLNLVFYFPYNTECAVFARPGLPLEAVMPELVSAMETLCRRERRFLMAVGNIPAGDLPAWERAGFLASPQASTNILDLPETYDLYLLSLRPKDRAELRRIRKRADELEVHFKIEGLAEDGEQIYTLFKNVSTRHGASEETIPFTPQFFAEFGHHMAEQTLFVKGFVENRLAGALLCSWEGATLWWQMAGLDYERARPTYLYFLLMDEMIRWSIAHGVRRIYGGFSSDREKQGHGFRAEPRWMCYRACSRPLNRLLTLALPLARRLMGRQKKAG